MHRLVKGILSPVLPEDSGMTLKSPPETSNIWSTCQLLIERYKSQGGSSLSSGSGSGSSLGSGLGFHRKGRPPRAHRSRGRGRSRGRSSLSSVIDPSPCSTIPYTNAFPTFVYPFIENWKNVIGDKNCGYWVVADFVFGDEHQWREVCRPMVFELEHTTNMYISLFELPERVYELIRRTQWHNRLAPLDHWLETPDSLIENAFNLCVILIAQLGSTIVLPLHSYSDRQGSYKCMTDDQFPFYTCNGFITVMIESVRGQRVIMKGFSIGTRALSRSTSRVIMSRRTSLDMGVAVGN
ncbi:hypothetical protein M9H77_08434 [Catharanthus roseus]|uniref:Uncharacterized protein n=1 Tax=Catharanthus roseus TaxID=4058 RepID=A0ACC0BXX5_CATRO|nr:hypothetical protein M9H77_08434 [Catharanthus roseus]